MGALISGETTTEAYHQRIGIDAFEQRNHTRGIALILQPRLCEFLADIVYELLFQRHTRIPDLVVGHIVNSVPNRFITLVAHKRSIEVLGVEFAPLGSGPGW